MARSKRWDQVAANFLLKLDPFYNKKINDCEEFVPSEKDFFTKLYMTPSTWNESDQVDDRIRKKIKSRTKNLVLCIKGYAGCGKSVYVQRLMYDFYPKNNNFINNTYNMKFQRESSIHRLEIGAGTSEHDIKSRYIDDLSKIIAEGIFCERDLYQEFCTIVVENDDAIKYIDNALTISDNFVNLDSIKNSLDKPIDKIKDTIRLELKKFEISILLAIDCLWRISIHSFEKRKMNKRIKDAVFFICFDNLDAIDDIEMCRDFLQKMCEFKINLDECLYYLNNAHKEYDVKTFTFFMTCRNVTWGRLHLSEYVEDDDGGDIATHLCDYDISEFYEYVDIVKGRILYYSEKAGDNSKAIDIIDDMKLIQDLNQMLFVKERFKPLFNYNYRKCIDVICEIIPSYRKYLLETIALAKNKYDINSDGIYSGSSSVFFRIIFEYLKNNNLFETEKMDLVDICLPHFEKDNDTKMLTSQARIILMYMYNESQKFDGGATRLDQIFSYFEPIYPLENVCDTLNNLFARNSAWRRPINFSKRPLKEHREKEDLEEQLRRYRSRERVGLAEAFTKFEICKAGKEYIEFVITHFEFYACRCSTKKNFLPPLFSEESIDFFPELDKFQFEITCETVAEAVENCCKKLKVFNEYVMSAKNLSLEKYLHEPINGRTIHGNKPQLHEERVIFCHIYHLEAYRYYLINTRFKEEKTDRRAEINRRMIEIILRYVKIYQDYIQTKEQSNIAEALVKKAGIIEKERFFDFHTRISKN